MNHIKDKSEILTLSIGFTDGWCIIPMVTGVGKVICFEQKGRKFITTIEVIKKDVGKYEVRLATFYHNDYYSYVELFEKYTAAGKVALYIENNLVEYVNKLIDNMI